MFGEIRKFLFKWRLTALAAVALACITYGQIHRAPVYHEVNAQRRAAHLINFVEVNELSGERKVTQSCTATAVGPQALLTAEHCIEGVKGPVIMLDLSPVLYEVDAGVSDGRDHVILHVKNIKFKNTIQIKERVAKLGEKVHLYGNGGDDFPSHALHGTVIPDDYEGDLSDVDEYVGTANFSLHVIAGDSGSAVYGDDGSIVGLVSLGRGYSAYPYDYATGYALNFSPEVIEMVSK